MSDREQMQYDFVVVGAGPAGLACALRLKQLKPDAMICVLEKGSTVGAHSLSGAVLEPGPLQDLLPDWRASYTGMAVPAQHDEFHFLTTTKAVRLPLPPTMRNHGNFIVSLSQLTAWLAQQAEGAGIDVFAGFAAEASIYNNDGAVAGVRIG
ncbi:MAG TPA: NAD(P)/FAD-dependent oxidoreductase, partial [Steroidobacteraceae bacterium]